MIYWDTSVVLKLYVEEGDSLAWQTCAISQQEPLLSSDLLLAELAHALKQKEVRAEIVSGSARHLYDLFCKDLYSGRYLLIPIGRDVLQLASRFALEGTPLRTLDGLHLATAMTAKCRQIATADQRLAEAAVSKGLDLLIQTGG